MTLPRGSHVRWAGLVLVLLGVALAGALALQRAALPIEPGPPVPRPPPAGAVSPVSTGGPDQRAGIDGANATPPPVLTGNPPEPPAPPTLTPTAEPPPHVGLQVGHWQSADLPDALARLRDHTGTAAAGRTELDLNLDVAQRTALLLERAGVVVDLLPATVPNGYRADAFVAIHADANFVRPVRGYKGAPPWRSAVAWRDAVLVDQLETAYAAATGLPRDPEVTENMRGYYATNGWMGDESRISPQTPSAVMEIGFMTSAADRAILFDQPDQVAAGLAAGILAYLHARPQVDVLQQRASALAVGSPTGCSVVVLRDAVPLRAGPDPNETAVAWVDRGAMLPYMDSTARPQGPFTDAQGRSLAIQTGYYRIDPPGGGAPAYINRALVVVQLPGP